MNKNLTLYCQLCTAGQTFYCQTWLKPDSVSLYFASLGRLKFAKFPGEFYLGYKYSRILIDPLRSLWFN